MFVLGKIVVWLSEPANVLLGLLIAGSLLQWRGRRLGRWIITATVLLMTVIAVLPVGMALTAILEDRFPRPQFIEKPIHGIIVLGGVINPLMSELRGQISVNEPVERLTEFVALARRFPEAKLIFSGGSGSLLRPDLKEAVLARRFFAEMGFDHSRVIYESESRSTFENALFSYKLLNPEHGERWLMVTSANHVPRAVGCFRKLGWDVIAYPVDYRTGGGLRGDWHFDFGAGLGSLNGAAYEWLALVGYWLFGRTSTLFPAP